jgi:hypothetical protein
MTGVKAVAITGIISTFVVGGLSGILGATGATTTDVEALAIIITGTLGMSVIGLVSRWAVRR